MTKGEWEKTPFWLRWFGKSARRRPTYADWRIGGGFDGWEYEHQ